MSGSYTRLSLVLAVAAMAPAATVYTDQTTFQAALDPGFYTETFSLGLGSNQPVFSFTNGTFSYQISSGSGDAYYAFSEFMATYDSNRSLIITFTSGNVYGVGGLFFHTDVQEAVLFNSAMTITLSDGTVENIPLTAGNDYRGFIANVPITSLTISAAGAGLFNSVDNLTVGGLPSQVVPEPSSVALLLGAGALGAWRLRRRA